MGGSDENYPEVRPLKSNMNPSSEEKQTVREKDGLELQRLRKEIEKLALEVEALRTSTKWDRMIGRYLPIITALLAVAGFWVGLIQYNLQRGETQNQQQTAEKNKLLELKREVAKPFWETQLSLYIKAAEAVATIATANDQKARSDAEATFWVLYWGPLSCVEDMTLTTNQSNEVEAAMVRFGNELKKEPADRSALQHSALAIAHAIRNQIAPVFELTPGNKKYPEK
jgi:hypothetical protein